MGIDSRLRHRVERHGDLSKYFGSVRFADARKLDLAFSVDRPEAADIYRVEMIAQHECCDASEVAIRIWIETQLMKVRPEFLLGTGDRSDDTCAVQEAWSGPDNYTHMHADYFRHVVIARKVDPVDLANARPAADIRVARIWAWPYPASGFDLVVAGPSHRLQSAVCEGA